MEFDSSDQRKLIKFVKNIQKIAPQLSSLYIKSSFVYDLLTAIINGSIAHSLTIKMELVLIYLFPTDGTFSVTLDPIEQCKAH